MNFKVREMEIKTNTMIGGLAYIPYQFAVGMSARMWCTGPAYRFYLGPFKFWISFIR